MKFADRVNLLLEIGHWKKWNGKEPMHFIIDPKSWPKYDQMDPRTGRSKKKKKIRRIAGKI